VHAERAGFATPQLGGQRHRRAFTVIDVLVSVAVITLLISLLIPGLSLVRETARRVVCASNVRQVGLGLAMYADDNHDLLPEVNLVAFGLQEQYQLSMRVRIAPSQWDGLGRLWSGEYLSSGQVFYCPSHTGEHPYSAYAAQWSGADGEIFGNMQYRFRPPSSRDPRISLFSAPGMALLADGLRTQDDFNHRVGSNVMRTDLAVLWFADPTGQVIASLPTSEDAEGAAELVEEAWGRLDEVNGEGR
jgi:competence protein ComGC